MAAALLAVTVALAAQGWRAGASVYEVSFAQAVIERTHGKVLELVVLGGEVIPSTATHMFDPAEGDEVTTVPFEDDMAQLVSPAVAVRNPTTNTGYCFDRVNMTKDGVLYAACAGFATSYCVDGDHDTCDDPHDYDVCVGDGGWVTVPLCEVVSYTVSWTEQLIDRDDTQTYQVQLSGARGRTRVHDLDPDDLAVSFDDIDVDAGVLASFRNGQPGGTKGFCFADVAVAKNGVRLRDCDAAEDPIYCVDGNADTCVNKKGLYKECAPNHKWVRFPMCGPVPVLCNSRKECFDRDLHGDYAVTCSADYSCEQADIATTGDVECTGVYACSYATIAAEGDVTCSTRGSCSQATVTAAALSCTDTLACSAASLATDALAVTGSTSLYRANVRSTGLGAFTAHVTYKYSLQDTTFTCVAGTTTCTLDFVGIRYADPPSNITCEDAGTTLTVNGAALTCPGTYDLSNLQPAAGRSSAAVRAERPPATRPSSPLAMGALVFLLLGACAAWRCCRGGAKSTAATSPAEYQYQSI